MFLYSFSLVLHLLVLQSFLSLQLKQLLIRTSYNRIFTKYTCNKHNTSPFVLAYFTDVHSHHIVGSPNIFSRVIGRLSPIRQSQLSHVFSAVFLPAIMPNLIPRHINAEKYIFFSLEKLHLSQHISLPQPFSHNVIFVWLQNTFYMCQVAFPVSFHF